MATVQDRSRWVEPWMRRNGPTLVLFAAGVTLASGVFTALGRGTLAQVSAGIATTAVLGLLALLVGRSANLAPARDTLLVFTALSVFGWASTWIAAAPAVEAWLRAAPAPAAFLTVNAMKLTSVIPLLVLARLRGWRRQTWLVRFGNPRAATGIPHLSWPILGPIVIVVVLALFLMDVPAVAWSGLEGALAWLPVMVFGAAVNAMCEELLYRHAVISTAHPIMGAAPAIVLSSVIFGLGHLTGNPGGLTGMGYTAAYGAVCALAMWQTRGMCWNVLIHIFGDLAIVFTMTLAVAPGA